ncbi:MAG: lipoyl synthase [Candidatus Neomarinimicrobiota bacterium]|nr:lipoyl synthase [Candidatus Neomarinimicrobiota bacterium]RKY47942.1 MAG: lipoyl synthase [Candidatus Neomarinimicrobiota bacterium]RKY53397.1 MAG: lipoyl synthase [Candidatus Neomarinimicrobiota bacterium]HDN58798.1 lipoyl synthase [Candidatus Neomarinimicrobiota bacterium]
MILRKPTWLKIRVISNEERKFLTGLIKEYGLNTVCVEAKCPNLSDCWSRKTATFMINGRICTRNCRFCSVTTGKPEPLNPEEPLKVALAIRKLGLKYCVITSVTRDDLPDGGANQWAETILEIKKINPGVKVEVLIPDFKGNRDALNKIFSANPDVLGHNLETVKELYQKVRPEANYEISLEILKRSAEKGFITKTGIMVGLGETANQVKRLIDDVSEAGCKVLTIGQYLQPSKEHLSVARYVTPEEFENYHNYALARGIKYVFSAPLVRSSYHADEVFNQSA